MQTGDAQREFQGSAERAAEGPVLGVGAEEELLEGRGERDG